MNLSLRSTLHPRSNLSAPKHDEVAFFNWHFSSTIEDRRHCLDLSSLISHLSSLIQLSIVEHRFVDDLRQELSPFLVAPSMPLSTVIFHIIALLSATDGATTSA